jgi:hypothetical protein
MSVAGERGQPPRSKSLGKHPLALGSKKTRNPAIRDRRNAFGGRIEVYEDLESQRAGVGLPTRVERVATVD